MSTIQALGEPIVRAHITRAVTDVLKVMLKSRVEAVAPGGPWGEVPPEVTAQLAAPHVVGSVGFVGDINGLVYLCLPTPFARMATCRLLGLSDSELTDAGEAPVTDAVGELTNMTVGSFKNALCDAGYPCKLTIPSILRARNFCIQSTRRAEHRSYRFTCGSHRLVADIIIKSGD